MLISYLLTSYLVVKLILVRDLPALHAVKMHIPGTMKP